MTVRADDRALVVRQWARLPDGVRATVAPWLLSRGLVLSALVLARFIGDELHATGRHHVTLSQGLFGWDAAYYRDIAAHGYDAVRHAQGLRFFPLVALLARVPGWLLGGRYGLALLLVVNAAAFGYGVLLHRLVVRETKDDRLAEYAVWLGFLAPAGLALVAGYAESVLLVCSVVAFLALRSRRWELAALAGFAAALTRPVGAFLIVPAAIEAARGLRVAGGREWLRRGFAVAAPAMGTACYLIWVDIVYGDGFAPLRLQNSVKLRGGWEEPVGRLLRAARDLMHHRVGSGLHVVWVLLAIALVVVAFRRLPSSYGAFAALSVLVAASAHNLDSFERYALAAFPLTIVAALVTWRPPLDRLVLVGSGAVLFGYSVLGFLGVSVP